MPHMFNVQGTVLLSKSFFFSVKSITMLIWILLAFVFFVMLAGGGYFAYTKYGKKDSAGSAGSAGDTITLGTDGVTRSGGSTTETYLAMPLNTYCSHSSGNPDWCNLTPTTEMQYVYDPVGGGMNNSGSFTTTFDNNTGLCSDGTRDCIYTEVYDSARMLTHIVNEKGENMVDKFVDDLWSGKLQFSDENIEEFKKMVTFEDGKLYIVMKMGNNDEDKKIQIVPGTKMGPTTDGKMEVPPGIIILWVSFYYKFNNKPKPNFNFKMKFEKPMGEIILAKIAADAQEVQERERRAQAANRPQPSTTR
jgi:hypothetical protein